MDSNAISSGRSYRKYILTQEAVELLKNGLREWWEPSHERHYNNEGKLRGKPKTLSRADIASKLCLDKKTVDNIYNSVPVRESVLDTAFKALNLSFSKERFCLPASIAAPLRHFSTSCIGRETQVAEIKKILKTYSLVTLTGAGGIGKTRLALHVAEAMEDQYADGIRFVELTGLTDQTLVPQVVASQLNIRERSGLPLIQALADFLSNKQMLLILDNCEHLLEGCAVLAKHLLSPSSALKILLTSRERLKIPAEYPFYVPSLSLPSPAKLPQNKGEIAAFLLNHDSVRLFVERAGMQQKIKALTYRKALTLISICSRMDGIPLAIELAAARVGFMTLEELNGKLEDSSRILTDGSKTVLPRHKTLQAVMDCSYDLLDESEKTLFARLSAFMGGWTLEAAEQVCSGGTIETEEVFELLTALYEKSLVKAVETGKTTRYRFHEIARQYAQRKHALDAEAELYHRQHQDYFLRLAEGAKQGDNESEWMHRIETEYDNLRTALEWSLREDTEVSLRLCKALLKFWLLRGNLSEGITYWERALKQTADQEPTSARAKALGGAGTLAYYYANYALARPYLEESLAICRKIQEPLGIAKSLNTLAAVVCNQGDFAAAQSYCEECLALCRELGDKNGVANALNGLGSIAEQQGDFKTAILFYQESLALRRALLDRHGIANALINLGGAILIQGDVETAQTYYKESLNIWRRVGYESGTAFSLIGLGRVAQAFGNYSDSLDYFEESLAICRKIEHRGGMVDSLTNMGNSIRLQGNYALARVYHEESLAISRETDNQNSVAFALIGLGNTVLRQGEYNCARVCFYECLTIQLGFNARYRIIIILESYAFLAFKENQPERAVALWKTIESIRQEIGLPRLPNERELFNHVKAETHQILGEEAFTAAWTKDTLTVQQAVESLLEK